MFLYLVFLQRVYDDSPEVDQAEGQAEDKKQENQVNQTDILISV